VLARAIDANRNAVAPYLTRARYTYRLPHRDAAAMEYMLADYAIAAKLNPKETSILIEYGHLLEEAGRGRDAATHYRAALAVNDAYRPDEPERLTATQVSELKAAIARLAP
jgi:Tfp pilus assembly protein PilF